MKYDKKSSALSELKAKRQERERRDMERQQKQKQEKARGKQCHVVFSSTHCHVIFFPPKRLPHGKQCHVVFSSTHCHVTFFLAKMILPQILTAGDYHIFSFIPFYNNIVFQGTTPTATGTSQRDRRGGGRDRGRDRVRPRVPQTGVRRGRRPQGQGHDFKNIFADKI
jgi:hypothetical protein